MTIDHNGVSADDMPRLAPVDDRNVALGAAMRCLCGAVHPRGPDGELEKTLWSTCEECWNQACIMAGLRPRS